jgi:hypothetical protein
MINKPFAALGLAFLVGVSACNNDALTSVNKNPNAPEQVSSDLLFATAAIRSVDAIRNDIEITPSTFVHWPQYLAEYQYPEISFYQFRPTTADGWWNTFYAGPLEDLAQALKQSTAAERPNQIGPILVMRAFNYSVMTGMWGDIPFAEANRGDAGVIAPKYDTQQAIYDSLLKNLGDANTMMSDAAGVGFGSQDPVYNGDVAQWKKLANALHARLGLNLSQVDATRARAEVSAAIAAGGFESNDDNAQITWPGDGINDNPWYDNQKDGGIGTRDDARLSVTFVDTLKHLADPRLAVFARPVQEPSCGTVPSCTAVSAGDYRGMPNGLLAGDAGSWGPLSSRLGLQVSAASQPSYIMTFAEYSFIKAEAAERGWITGSAAQFYNDGITASMKQWGVSDAAIATYLAQSKVAYTAGATGLAKIGLQKWIALFTQGFEAWSEWRRTGFPNLTPALNAKTANGQIPRRVIYPQTEQSFNLANLKAAITAQGGSDALDKKLWIDK